MFEKIFSPNLDDIDCNEKNGLFIFFSLYSEHPDQLVDQKHFQWPEAQG